MTSVVIIILNAEKTIERCLSSIKNNVTDLKEIICVLDTKTTDRTRERIASFMMASGVSVRVYDREWEGHAAARNFGISQCTGDVIAQIDSDEEVILWNKPDGNYNVCTIENVVKGRSMYFPAIRVYQNNIGVKYEGKIQAIPDKSLMGKKEGTAQIIIKHYGYDLTAEQMLAKTQKNLELHLQQLDEEPEHLTVEYYLANCYRFLGEWQNAIDYAVLSLTKPINKSMITLLYIVLFFAYNGLNKKKIAVKWLIKSIETEPLQILGRILLAEILNQEGDKDSALEHVNIIEKISLNKNSKLPNDYYYNQEEIKQIRSRYAV